MPRAPRTEVTKAVQFKLQPHTHEMLRQLAFLSDKTMSEMIEKLVADAYTDAELKITPVSVPAPAESPVSEWVAVAPETMTGDLKERFALVDAAVDAKVDHGSSRRARPDFPADDIPDL